MVQEPSKGWIDRNRLITQLARTPRCDLGLRYFDISMSTGVSDAHWQRFQVEALNTTSILTSYNKSRQIGMSFTLSADSLFDGLLKNNHTVINVSFNLEEAREKILYTKQWWESRNPNPATVPARDEFDESGNWLGPSPNRIQHWPELIVDNSLEMRWANGLRIISHPCRPPRGKKASVVLDEFAHYQHDGVIYTAALPMITRGIGGSNRLTIASTPLGASGKFWDIHDHPNDYPDFERYDYGWWEIEDLCPAELRLTCLRDFLNHETSENLIRRYGTQKLKFLKRNAIWEDFLQEYCLQFLDAVHSFLTWDLIRRCYPLLWDPERDETEDEEQFNSPDYEDRYVCFKARTVDDAMVAIDNLCKAIDAGRVCRRLTLAYDCGRDRDASEFTVFEIYQGHYYQRLIITLRQVNFDDQQAVMDACCGRLPIVQGMLDKGGPGRQLAEKSSQRWGNKAEGVWFDAPKKELWATTTKREMERGAVTLIPDRDQEQQLHSIRRRASNSKNMLYEIVDSYSSVGGGGRVKHHADKFWVVSMGVYLCSVISGNSGEILVVVPPENKDKTAVGAADVLTSKGFKGTGMSRSREAADKVANRMRCQRR